MSQSERLTVRTASRADAPAIYEVHRASLLTLCATHYAPDTLERWFGSKTIEGYYPALDAGEMFVCERGGVVAGFGHAVPGEVAGLFVRPDFARQGIGAHLLAYALECARHGHSGPVRIVATLNAEPFYAKHGFCVVERYVIVRGEIEFPVVDMVLV